MWSWMEWIYFILDKRMMHKIRIDHFIVKQQTDQRTEMMGRV